MQGRLEKGLVQVYTGSGKGKTTAALGLGLRAVGQGFKVYVIQFVKGGQFTGELTSTKLFGDNYVIEQFGHSGGFIGKPSELDFECAAKALDRARAIIGSGEHDLVILDEINIALRYGLISVDAVLELINTKPAHVELVLTGRNVPEEIVKSADLVTELLAIKHPFEQGIDARRGIEY